MSGEKRAFEADAEIEEAIFEELSKKQKTEQEPSLEEQFQDALENVQDRAAIDREKLVQKACEHYAKRNGCAPSVEELEDIFETLADDFLPEDKDDVSSESDSSDSEDDSEDEIDCDSINSKNMSDGLLGGLNSALDHVHALAKQDKAKLQKKIEQKWKEANGSEISAEESEAVFAVLGKMINDGPASVSPGDSDEYDADYELTQQDKQIEKEDAEYEESECESEAEEFVCLDGELEFTSPTCTFEDVVEEVLEELGLEITENEDQTIEYESNIEVSSELVKKFKSQCPGATESDIVDVLTTKIADAEFDEYDDEEYQPEPEYDEGEESVYEEVDEEDTADPKFLDLQFSSQDDGEEYTFDDFAADHLDEQDSDEYSDSSAEESADDEAEEQQTYSNLKSRSTGLSTETSEIQQKHFAAMEIDQSAQFVA